MHSKSDNKETMINDKADEVIERLFKSFLNRYQHNLERPMRGSDFIFDCVHLLYYKCRKINSICRRSYIDSHVSTPPPPPPPSKKKKKTAMNPINKKDNRRFQYAVIVALNHAEIGKYSERITKIKNFYKWT